MDLVLEKMAWKIETGEVIPCLGLAGGFMGSCTIKLCESLDQIPDFFCPFFPENLPCNCPFLATSGTVKLNLTFSEEYIMYGPGDYEQKLRLISEANPEENLACVDIKYTLINA
ncbi:hypothetical protein QYM36_000353 [Artemia franciscana]|nr:hypothetical protein QYM36_000353 [Artemia franciscana]KAK2725851.1 hypothetical protein QYM36_000353 [Artemia franciscana]KAK2725852.1 hypothetical protein QYM36_000353 [Artemia franciscana]KAK2725853.1 hypothetical protein QYM36_000353 [Artemia franciscana]